jgi:hypothetical protein
MAESTVVSCPACGKKYKIAADKLGRTFKCTGCETKFKAGEESVPVALPPVAAPPVVVEPPDVSETETDSATSEGGEMTAAPPAASYSSTGIGKPKTSGLAIASLVCGLIGCIPFAQILAVIFGFLGLKKIKAGLASGKGLAITGIILGVLGIIAYGAVGGAVYVGYTTGGGFLGKVFNMATMGADMARIRQSIISYQQKNGQHFPTDLATLWRSDPTLGGKVFVVAGTGDTPAATPDQLESGGHNSFKYVYPGPEATAVTAADLLLYTKTPAAGTNQCMLMFGDGSVKSCSPAELPGYIARTAKHPAMPTTP